MKIMKNSIAGNICNLEEIVFDMIETVEKAEDLSVCNSKEMLVYFNSMLCGLLIGSDWRKRSHEGKWIKDEDIGEIPGDWFPTSKFVFNKLPNLREVHDIGDIVDMFNEQVYPKLKHNNNHYLEDMELIHPVKTSYVDVESARKEDLTKLIAGLFMENITKSDMNLILAIAESIRNRNRRIILGCTLALVVGGSAVYKIKNRNKTKECCDCGSEDCPICGRASDDEMFEICDDVDDIPEVIIDDDIPGVIIDDDVPEAQVIVIS